MVIEEGVVCAKISFLKINVIRRCQISRREKKTIFVLVFLEGGPQERGVSKSIFVED